MFLWNCLECNFLEALLINMYIIYMTVYVYFWCNFVDMICEFDYQSLMSISMSIYRCHLFAAFLTF